MNDAQVEICFDPVIGGAAVIKCSTSDGAEHFFDCQKSEVASAWMAALRDLQTQVRYFRSFPMAMFSHSENLKGAHVHGRGAQRVRIGSGSAAMQSWSTSSSSSSASGWQSAPPTRPPPRRGLLACARSLSLLLALARARCHDSLRFV